MALTTYPAVRVDSTVAPGGGETRMVSKYGASAEVQPSFSRPASSSDADDLRGWDGETGSEQGRVLVMIVAAAAVAMVMAGLRVVDDLQCSAMALRPSGPWYIA